MSPTGHVRLADAPTGLNEVQGVLEAIPDGVVIINRDGIIEWVNRQIEAQFGYPRAELLNQPIELLLPERFRSSHRLDRAAYVAEPRIRPMGAGVELFGRRRDGVDFPVEISLSPLGAGSDLRVIASVRDVTERRQAEAAIRARERRIEAVFNQAFEFIGLLSVDGRVIEANRAALEFIGVDESTVLGQPFWTTPWWTDLPEAQARLRAAIAAAAHGEFVRFETPHRGSNGQIITVDFTLKPVYNDQDQVVFLVPEGRDITDRKRLERALAQREAEFRLLWECDRIAKIEIDVTRRVITRANREFGELFGGDLADVIGQSPTRFVHPDDVDVFRAATQRVLRGDTDTPGREARCVTLRGDVIWAQVTTAILETVDGRPTRVLDSFQDITARKAAEAALAASQAQSRQLFERLPMPAWVFDFDTLAILDVNSAAVRHFGYSRAELLTMTILDLRTPTDIEALMDARRGDVADVATEHIWRYRLQDGRLVDMEIISQPIAMPGRRAKLVVARDITTERELAREREAVDQQRREFFANVAHDLKNPLAAIKLSTGVVLENLPTTVPAPIRRMLTNTDAAADRAIDLIGYLRDLSQAELKALTLTLGPTDLTVLVRRVANGFEALARTRDQRFEVTLPAGPVVVMIDAGRISRVLLNLLSNAHKYGRAGGLIHLALRDRGAEVEVSVRDDGLGIPTADQARIFERFYRSAAARSSPTEGSGLGLAIARAVVEAHGGRIWVESVVGEGATFAFTLPKGAALPDSETEVQTSVAC